MTGITWPMRMALCALAGGPAIYLHNAYIDLGGQSHAVNVVTGLVQRRLAERIKRPDGVRIARLTDKGRWFAATALGEMADVLIMASARDAVAEARELMASAEYRPVHSETEHTR